MSGRKHRVLNYSKTGPNYIGNYKNTCYCKEKTYSFLYLFDILVQYLSVHI